MQLNDPILYRIQITGLAKSDVSIVATRLGISYNQMIISTDSIIVPRLYTHWRSETAEQAWQDNLRKAVGTMGTVVFDVQPWSPAPGYPMGEISEPSLEEG